jgi:hypothetical protein
LSQTNNFGLSWKKPLGQILIITVLFYPFVVVSGSDKLVWCPATSFSQVTYTFIVLWSEMRVFWQMFNPARLTFRMFPDVESLHASVHFFDNFHRIILAFYIFQIISAFRKYIK